MTDDLVEARWDAAPGVTFLLELVPGGRLVSFTARADDRDAGTVTATALRNAPVVTMAQEARRWLRSFAAEIRDTPPNLLTFDDSGLRPTTAAERAEGAAQWRQHAKWFDSIAARPGRAGRGLLFFADLAAEYSALVDDGEANPIAVIAQRRDVPTETVRGQVNQARRAHGLLTDAPPGRAGGVLTDKAKEILDGNR